MAPALSNVISSSEVTNNPRLRDIKNSDFSRFLKLVEKREPIFKKALGIANHVIIGGFFDGISFADTSIDDPQTILSSLPLG